MRMLIVVTVLVMTAGAVADEGLKFERMQIGKVTYEAASAFDVNKDGAVDIVCGEYWFEGPDFAKEHKICDLKKELDYYDEFSAYPLDVNGDGYLDLIGGGWWNKTLLWRENPKGGPGKWKTHVIDECGNVETTRLWDVDGDGYVEAVPNAGGRVAVYKLKRDKEGKPTGEFAKCVVKEKGCGHGLGFGDINGDELAQKGLKFLRQIV